MPEASLSAEAVISPGPRKLSATSTQRQFRRMRRSLAMITS